MKEGILKVFKKNNLEVRICQDGVFASRNAADFVEDELHRILDQKPVARIVLATGASQFHFYKELGKKKDLPWNRVTVFHLDEYAGMDDSHPASFRKYLKERILDEVKPGKVHFLTGDATNLEEETEKYTSLLMENPVDLACIGIGENGHIAFNDPPVADFKDPLMVKVVKLDEACRRQQLGEGWFKDLDEVPTHALTLTVPAIMRAMKISCLVPDRRKALAVADALEGPISEKCPASILRNHPGALLFLDSDSASLLRDQ
jgi:glucosamine-6-phosphate deaminase